jgi:3-oxoacyl-[acyl-carrier protein] reductase
MTRRADFPAGIALVTGGSGGVGRAVCARLAEAGADVALTYRRGKARAEEAVLEVQRAGRKAEMHAVSLEDSAAVVALAADLVERFGAIHTVIHAVGADIPMRYVSQITPETFREVMVGDATGFFHVVHATLPHLRASHGSLVAITSAGLRRYPVKDVLSVAPKGAIEALVRAVASEEGRFGVRANSVALGVIEAGIFLRLEGKELDPRWIEAAKQNTAMRRFGTADEVADAAVFLASSRASYITGQVLSVDGGYSV